MDTVADADYKFRVGWFFLLISSLFLHLFSLFFSVYSFDFSGGFGQ